MAVGMEQHQRAGAVQETGEVRPQAAPEARRTAVERVDGAEQRGDDGGCVEARWTGPRRDEERGRRPKLVLMPGAPDMDLRYYSTSRAQELLGLAHPSRQWSRSKTRKEEMVAKTRWPVGMVTETKSDAVVGMRAPGRPRRQETKQASKRKEEEAEEEEEEKEEEEEPAQKRRKR